MRKKKKAANVKTATVEKKRHIVSKHKDAKDAKDAKNGKDGKAHAGNAVQTPPTKIKNPKKRGVQEVSPALLGDDGQKMSRLTVIKTRHEAMKREIDQIREDLESEEEE